MRMLDELTRHVDDACAPLPFVHSLTPMKTECILMEYIILFGFYQVIEVGLIPTYGQHILDGKIPANR
jgi:hypothetical protein